jgi:hypothetical protein
MSIDPLPLKTIERKGARATGASMIAWVIVWATLLPNTQSFACVGVVVFMAFGLLPQQLIRRWTRQAADPSRPE